MGNTDHNHQITLQDLGRGNVEEIGRQNRRLLFEGSTVDLIEQVRRTDHRARRTALVSAVRGPADRQRRSDAQPLISRVRVRYPPTVGLAIPYQHARKPEPKPTGVVVGKLFPHDDETVAQDAFESLQRALKRAVVLPRNPQAPSAWLRTLLDGLIVLDDIEDTDGAYGWSPTQLENRPVGRPLSAG